MNRDWIKVVARTVVCSCILVLSVTCTVRTKSSCYNNLRNIDGSKIAWSEDHGKTNGVVREKDLIPYLLHKELPKCPLGGKYTIGLIGEPPKCSYPSHAYP